MLTRTILVPYFWASLFHTVNLARFFSLWLGPADTLLLGTGLMPIVGPAGILSSCITTTLACVVLTWSREGSVLSVAAVCALAAVVVSLTVPIIMHGEDF